MSLQCRWCEMTSGVQVLYNTGQRHENWRIQQFIFSSFSMLGKMQIVFSGYCLNIRILFDLSLLHVCREFYSSMVDTNNVMIMSDAAEVDITPVLGKITTA